MTNNTNILQIWRPSENTREGYTLPFRVNQQILSFFPIIYSLIHLISYLYTLMHLTNRIFRARYSINLQRQRNSTFGLLSPFIPVTIGLWSCYSFLFFFFSNHLLTQTTELFRILHPIVCQPCAFVRTVRRYRGNFYIDLCVTRAHVLLRHAYAIHFEVYQIVSMRINPRWRNLCHLFTFRMRLTSLPPLSNLVRDSLLPARYLRAISLH